MAGTETSVLVECCVACEYALHHSDLHVHTKHRFMSAHQVPLQLMRDRGKTACMTGTEMFPVVTKRLKEASVTPKPSRWKKERIRTGYRRCCKFSRVGTLRDKACRLARIPEALVLLKRCSGPYDPQVCNQSRQGGASSLQQTAEAKRACHDSGLR
jgi:hypothetical protein